MKVLKPFTIFYAIVLLVQLFAAAVTVDGVSNWYQSLEKASWTPPGWVFGPVWTILYIMMSVSVAIVYSTGCKKKEPYLLFFLQLFVNGLWSYLFFGLQRPDLALIDLTILIILVGFMMRSFYAESKIAFWLLVPYFLWALYALSLNSAIYILN